MNKKIFSLLSVGMMVTSMLPISMAYAEIVEKPTTDSTLSSIAEGPLESYDQKADKQLPTSESAKEETTPEEVLETEDFREKASEEKAKDDTSDKSELKEQKVDARAITLKEGNPGDNTPYDIDANLAKVLRTDPEAGNYPGAGGTTTWSGYGKAENMLTVADMEALTYVKIDNKSLTSLKGIELATSLRKLNSDKNQLQDLDLSKNILLQELNCAENQLTTLDLSNNPELKKLYASSNNLTAINLNGLTELEKVSLYSNQLPIIDIRTNINLKELTIYNNQLPELDLSQNLVLKHLVCAYNQLPNLDVSKNTKLYEIACSVNQIDALDFSNNPDLRMVQAYSNKLTSINVTNSPNLEILYCEVNQLTELDVTNNPVLNVLKCGSNQLTELNVSQNPELKELDCPGNHLSDITSANGLANLTEFTASGQTIRIPVPVVTDRKATIDLLKTTAQAGLTVQNGFPHEAVIPYPSFSADGDVIKLDETSRLSLINKSIRFEYAGTQLAEGSNSGTKSFSGKIYFDAVSELENQLEATPKKVKDGEKVQWEWTITSLLPKKAENIYGTLKLPSGLTLIPGSIKIDGVSADIKDIDGTNNLGELDQDEVKVITFETTANGNVDDILEAKTRVNWEDDTITSPYSKETTGSVQIQKEVEKPSEDKDIALLSAPIAFNYGVKKVEDTASAYNLAADQYQDEKDVTTKGFYTRMKDERSTSTGWKLTAQLSEFKDSSKEVMPNSSGAALNFDGLTIESVTDQNTSQEAMDSFASSAPSKVKASESLVAGDSPTTLVSAKAGEGKETWQLRMPFEKISLKLPAKAGKKGANYQAKITWSMDDTP
ncbi:WxL domain-containing protein [Enterococcus avium]|uniref:WxL domain-containing protein n=1 Tax=Enterococcus avium TaxID=33945 RepID=UPI001D071C65|nr:WxL domain-containing protein [Enterococcus avium]MCB6917306.1 WxL domain-containing protein [Enterococcus avium]MCQ4961458.1 WxL domain-containing protein [Enterococcus avium]